MSWYDPALDVLDPGGTRHVFEQATADTSALTEEQKAAQAQADKIAAERAGLGVNPALQQQTANQQHSFTAGLQAAAAGTVPSVAQQQLADQARIAAARQIGLAKAMPGHSAGGTGRTAALGVAQVQGQARDQSQVLGAQEQAAARGQLAGALQGQRQQDLGVYQGAQAARDANMAAILQQNQINAQNAQSIANANATAAGATNAKRASIIGGGAALGQSLLSDRSAKDNIRDVSMADAIGKEVRGVTFEYKKGLGDGGKHFGVIAQELARAIPGVVSERPDGLKEIAIPHLTAANTGALSELARRVKALEGRK